MTMRLLSLIVALLAPCSALAADNAVLLTPCASGCVTMRSKDIGGGVQSAINILGDTTGAAIYGTAGTANANVLTIQGIASMTKLLVTPDSVALPANQSVNVAQINGVTALMGNGVTGTGSPRVTIASDNTAFSVNATLSAETSKVIGTVQMASGGVASGAYSSGSFASGAMVDLLTMRGTKAPGTAAANSMLGGGVYTAAGITLTDGQQAALQFTSTGGVHMNVDNATPGIANNADGIAAVAASATSPVPVNGYGYCWNGSTWDRCKTFAGATGAAPPAAVAYLGANASGATGGQLKGLIACDNYVFKHITSATDTLAVQGVASQTIYVCGFHARAAGTATWFLENTASANANCSSSNTQIAVLNTEAVNTGIVDRSPFWSGLKNTLGNGLCINSTGTGGVDVGIYYTQL